MKKISLIFLLVLYSTFIFAAPDKTSTDKTIIRATKMTDQFDIRLPSTPSTGYSWFLTATNNLNLIRPISHQYIASSDNKPGAGGVELWTFKLSPDAFAVPYQLNLTFVYARPWEKTAAKSMTYTIFTSDN